MKTPIDYNKQLFNFTFLPFLLYGILGVVYAYKANFSWFSWHPLLMVLSFITLAGNACVIKRIGGYQNTKNHGILMTIACILAGFAWYVIHTNKELMKKKHLLTLHGNIGASVLVGYFIVGIVGAVALHPDWGILKKNTSIRAVHKWVGRILTAGAWASCVLGFNTLYNEQLPRLLFGAPLFMLGLFVLLI